MRANMEARKDDTPEAADQRERLRRALQLKNYEFNAHGVEFNQRYRSAAVVPDGTDEPPFDRDAELYYHPTTWPGARLPHCWVEHRGRRVSTIDLAGKGRFALLTGIGGDGWARAAEAVSARTGVEIAPFAIGPGRDVLDLYGDWAALSEVSDRGCVLVRPDLHVAWRSHDLVADPTAELGRVVDAILGIGLTRSDAEPSATSGRPLATA
jgi:2,4-dichlorophenol 6-monooxygenase